jgi:hypothetical protein
MISNVMLAGLRLASVLLFIGTAMGLVGSTWSQMVSATVEEVTPGSNDSSDIMRFKQHKDNPTQVLENQEEALNHINEAQTALQNGDTQSAQRHLDLAKQTLMFPPG